MEGVKRSLISRAKDATLEKAVLMLFRPKVERYGEIMRFKLDTSAKVLSADIRLRGEPIPLVISEAHYRIERQGKQAVLVLHDIKTSKEWLQNLLEDRFQEIRLKIPDVVRALID